MRPKTLSRKWPAMYRDCPRDSQLNITAGLSEDNFRKKRAGPFAGDARRPLKEPGATHCRPMGWEIRKKHGDCLFY